MPIYADGTGLTKREEFAKAAFQGILSSFGHPDVIHAVAKSAADKGMEADQWISIQAVNLADALLAALEAK